MTQEEFTYMASEMRTKAVLMAEQFGYPQDDAEDIAQDVMLRLWSLHGQLRDATHLKASTVIIAKRMWGGRWRTTHQHQKIDDAIQIVDEDTLHDQQEYEELEKWLDEQIGSLPSTSGMLLRMRQLEHRELREIADSLGIRQTSVSTLLSRARNELFNKLKRRKQQ
jgi:RNA polymerase sigma-70 factor (ECF subfamily)